MPLIQKINLDSQLSSSTPKLAGLFAITSLGILIGIAITQPSFPSLQNYLFWMWGMSLALVVPGWVYCRTVLNETWQSLGLFKRPQKKFWFLVLFAYLIMLPVIFLAAKMPEFLAAYPRYGDSEITISQFFIWEISYGLSIIAIEILFRGFLLIPTARKIGLWAVLLSAVPYALIHYAKPLPEIFAAFFAGIFLGYLVLRSRSLLPGILLHLSVAWTMDITALWQKKVLFDLLF